MSFQLEPGFFFGVTLASARIAGFVLASPIYARAIPAPGRLAFVVVLGLFFGEPVIPTGVGELVVWVLTNVAVGALLGFLTGLVFHLFAMAGSAVDFSSGLSIAEVFDPLSGSGGAPLSRTFNVVALALFFAVGGHRLVVEGLALSFLTVSTTGSLSLPPSIAEGALVLLGTLFLSALELAMPVLTALFVTELVLGIASRFAPQSNVLMVGLPLKLLVSLSSVAVVVVLMPDALAGTLRIMREAFVELARAFGS
ncbi:MAG TPA: type III secretion protein [Actinobacteria bacterium]|nr:type III secretion protein [Actinomycetota bacterium]